MTTRAFDLAAKRMLPWALAWAGVAAPAGWAQNTNRFEFQDGDRVVLVGDTLIEREPAYGQLEYLLTAQYPGRNLVFRNLGWSADLPTGRSRASFDWSKSTNDWFNILRAQIQPVKPTVAIIGYGMAASFDGEAGLEGFKAGMNRLLDTMAEDQPKIRFILLSPIRHEGLPPPWPDPAQHNEQLALYTKALKEIAQARQAHFVSFFDDLRVPGDNSQGLRLTDNGIHLNAYGYRLAAEVLATRLGWMPNTWRLGFTDKGEVRQGSHGTKVVESWRNADRLKAVTEEDMLVLPPLGQGTNAPPVFTPEIRMQVRGLNAGLYDILMDGAKVNSIEAKVLSNFGVVLDQGPQFDQARKLQQAIAKKNELFFHRWRPQNSTYLFLFRKYEQGQNAREIPMFDPLIEAAESEIAALKKPRRHTIEFVPSTASSASAAASAGKPPAETNVAEPPRMELPEFQTGDGVRIQLWAQNPLLAKPIQMNFDTKGRLWVASSSVYPQIKPGQAAEDKILILEDADQDGVAEKSTVFADGLLIPTGVEPGDGGAYVGQSTELLHYTDTDGDGRADARRIVLSGFGTEDTHHILHTLRWGWDGQLYMNQSIYIHTHLETPSGVVRLNSGGILRLRPADLRVGIFMKGLVNTWGHHFDQFGQSFATDGAGTPEAGLSGISYVVPGAMYHTYAGARRILGSISPGSYPKFASLEFLHSPAFPEAWQGQLVTCDFRANRVVRFAVEEKDSAFTATEQPLFLRSKSVSFRPIDAKVGPDGALYIADWSNPIIQHGEVDFRDPRRDHVNGRIWRVTMADRPGAGRAKLAGLAPEALLDLLDAPNGDTRKQARRLLLEHKGPVVESLRTWAAAQTAERRKLEALWMYQALDLPQPGLLGALLEAKDGRVRAAAVRVLAAWLDRVDKPVDLLAKRVADGHPRVRLEAVRALGGIADARAATLALSALDRPMDTHLDYALWLTINELAEPWLAAVRSGQWAVAGHEKQLEFALKALEPAQTAKVMSQLTAQYEIPRDGSGPWIDLIGKAGGPAELGKLYDRVVNHGFDEAGASLALAAVSQAARVRQVKPGADRKSLLALLDNPSETVRIEAAGLAGAWKSPPESVPVLAAMVRDAGASPRLQQAALDALRDIGGPAAVAALTPLCGSGTGADLRRRAVVAVAALDLKKGAPLAVEVLSQLQDEAAALELWRGLLRLKGASAEITKALPKTGLSPVLAKTGLRAAREGGRNEAALILALSRGADLDAAAQELTPEEMKQLAGSVAAQGDPARGESIYRRQELACVTCHAVGGVGGKVGPDLTSIGASAPIDYLIESLLYPNRKVKEGYHSVVIETKDAEEFSGILTRETTEQLFVRDALNRELAVAKSQVVRRTAGNSLMPAGLVDGLEAQDRLDLVRFLAELGKPGPFDATKGTVARLWRLSPVTIDLAQFGAEKLLRGDIRSQDWMPAMTTVDGRLLQSEMENALALKSWRNPQEIMAAAEFELAKPAQPGFQWALPQGTPAWVDGQPMDLAAAKPLAAGKHTLMLKLDARKLPDFIRVSADQGTFAVD